MYVLKNTDEQLMATLQKSFDVHLFNELVGRYEKKIFFRCKEYVQDEHTAKDLVQEVLLKIFLRLKSFRETERFSSWLHAIVNNTCLDFLRKNKKKFEGITPEVARTIVSDTQDYIPLEEQIKILEKLIDELKPEDKTILLLKYKENLSIKQIQKITELSESAVKMRLKRAKEKVANLMKGSSKRAICLV